VAADPLAPDALPLAAPLAAPLELPDAPEVEPLAAVPDEPLPVPEVAPMSRSPWRTRCCHSRWWRRFPFQSLRRCRR
jgi:hypothetical protein